MAPSALPIRTQAPEHELHETADQVGIMAIGQDTQTRVVDYQSQPLAPLLLSPTDKLIPRFEVKSGSAPGGHGQPLAFPKDRVTQLLAHQLRAVQVMVIEKNLITFLEVLGLNQQLDGHAQQNGLFVGRGPTKRRFALFHARRLKNFFPDVPQKVLTHCNGNVLPRRIDAPWPLPESERRNLTESSNMLLVCSGSCSGLSR